MDGSLQRANFGDFGTSFPFVAGDNFSSAVKSVIAAKAGYTLYIQQITLSVTTDNAATQTFQDTADTPVPIATSKASPGLGPIVWDFGADGMALTEGKGLSLKSSGAGMAAAVTVLAYRKLTAVAGLTPNH